MRILLEFMLSKLEIASDTRSDKFPQYLEECNRLLTDPLVIFNREYDKLRAEYLRILDKTIHL